MKEEINNIIANSSQVTAAPRSGCGGGDVGGVESLVSGFCLLQKQLATATLPGHPCCKLIYYFLTGTGVTSQFIHN